MELYNQTGAGIPDVSALGEVFTIINFSEDTQVAGTSCSAPTFSAIVGLLNEVFLALFYAQQAQLDLTTRPRDPIRPAWPLASPASATSTPSSTRLLALKVVFVVLIPISFAAFCT